MTPYCLLQLVLQKLPRPCLVGVLQNCLRTWWPPKTRNLWIVFPPCVNKIYKRMFLIFWNPLRIIFSNKNIFSSLSATAFFYGLTSTEVLHQVRIFLRNLFVRLKQNPITIFKNLIIPFSPHPSTPRMKKKTSTNDPPDYNSKYNVR